MLHLIFQGKYIDYNQQGFQSEQRNGECTELHENMVLLITVIHGSHVLVYQDPQSSYILTIDFILFISSIEATKFLTLITSLKQSSLQIRCQVTIPIGHI